MDESTRVGRRSFMGSVAGVGAVSGYSLIVKAEPAEAPAGNEPGASVPPQGDPGPMAEPNMRLVELQCDFLVAGGGMAGVCAAVAAARNGAKVVLVQDRSRLGGNASSEIRMHIVGADCHGGHSGWREGGILEELRLENAVRNPQLVWELWDLILYDKVVSEPNITLLLDSVLYRAEVEDGRIQRVGVRCDKTEELFQITAPQYADCTGDCRLGLEAGAAFRTGHEGRDAFGEALAPEQGGPETLGSSILFTSQDYGEPVPFVPPSWARKVSKKQLKHRGVGSWEYGYWWIEWGGRFDTIADNARIRHELLAIVLGVWDYIKNSGNHPESANWGMDWVGMIPGKRGNRRLEGPYMLTQQDLMGEKGDYPDAVAIGGWPFDNHPPGGFDDTDVRPAQQVDIAEVYNIPLRALFSRNIENLFMAGRNVSASHVAFTSMRVMGTCAVMGQAIGTAAAHCARHAMTPAQLCADPGHVDALRQNLLRDDQSIYRAKNEDPRDLARRARAAASGSAEGSAPESVVNGYLRDAKGKWKNRWGGPMDDGGAWIALRWDAPQRIGEVQITFDSGFWRELTLSESAWVNKRVVRGPQPETVRDYRVECEREDGTWQVLAKETDNYQRLRRHRFEPVKTRALRVRVSATHGVPQARIYEIRCYA